ncbi:MAG: alginate export family protein, partial [Gammaproteobacteria bacterium]|nr:alginate export family protein [Gammaproteobacteria bacterium]
MLCPAVAQAQGDAQRLEPAAETPDRLSISGSFRLRYESMENTFRLVGPAQDELLLSRLLVHAQVNGERFYGGFELQDSRAWLEQDLTPVGTDDVNALEPLRAYVGYRNENVDIQVGRMTMDVGSRRLVSRNRMRNTINSFTGVRAKWSKSGGVGLQAFLTMPVARLPNNLELDRLRNNEFELDQEHW